MGAGSDIDILWRSADVLTDLSGIITELLKQRPVSDQGLKEKCGVVVAAAAEIGSKLDGLAHLQAQRQDLDRQMADCVAIALKRLAASPVAIGARLSPGDLAALYVSEDQRQVHEAIISKVSIEAPLGSSQASTQGRIRERSGK